MQIIDSNYEENRYIVNTPTIVYDSNAHHFTFNPTILMDTLPSYVGMKNNASMHVPALRQYNESPFDNNNPDLRQLFGIHVYDKRFGFYDTKIVRPVTDYPYMGNDITKRGRLCSYNGIIDGNVLNGISADDVSVTIDGNTVQIDSSQNTVDDITNSMVLRRLYTDNANSEALQYGMHDNNVVSDYNYVEITPDNIQLVASDGYGEDAELPIEMYNGVISEYTIASLTVGGQVYPKTLKISKASIEQFDRFDVYKAITEATVDCTEQYWKSMDTTVSTESNFYELEVYKRQNKSWITTVGVTTNDYVCQDGNEIIHYKTLSYKLGENTYKLLKDNAQYKCVNYDTNLSTGNGCSQASFIAVAAGLNSIDANKITGTDTPVNDGGGYINIVFRENSEYIGEQLTEIHGASYRFNAVSLKIERLTQITSTTPVLVLDNGNYSIKLKCGLTIEFEDSDIGNNKTVLYHGVRYRYKLTNLNNPDPNAVILEYPQETSTSIFKLFETNALHGWDNKCEQIQTLITSTYPNYNFDEENVYYKLDDNTKSVFCIGVNGDERDKYSPVYYTYTPKLSLEIPSLYMLSNATQDENITLVITGQVPWADNDAVIISNEYIRYYGFTVNRLAKSDGDGEYMVEETVYVAPKHQLSAFVKTSNKVSDINGVDDMPSKSKDDSFYGYKVMFTGINSAKRVMEYKYTITDCIGVTNYLSLEETIIKEDTEA